MLTRPRPHYTLRQEVGASLRVRLRSLYARRPLGDRRVRLGWGTGTGRPTDATVALFPTLGPRVSTSFSTRVA